MTIDETTIQAVAKLARLHLTSQEVETMQSQLVSILSWVEDLNEVDTQAVEPLFNVNVSQMPCRQDIIDHQPMAQVVTGNAPDKAFDMFVVPKMVE